MKKSLATMFTLLLMTSFQSCSKTGATAESSSATSLANSSYFSAFSLTKTDGSAGFTANDVMHIYYEANGNSDIYLFAKNTGSCTYVSSNWQNIAFDTLGDTYTFPDSNHFYYQGLKGCTITYCLNHVPGTVPSSPAYTINGPESICTSIYVY